MTSTKRIKEQKRRKFKKQITALYRELGNWKQVANTLHKHETTLWKIANS